MITPGHWRIELHDYFHITTHRRILNVGFRFCYCQLYANGVPQVNPGTNLMQPYYYPFVTSIDGGGMNLQGYFDYRVKDSNEAVVAANSTDGGKTWTFQDEKLELNPGLCHFSANHTLAQDYPSNKTANPYSQPPASNVLFSDTTGSPGATDDGQGHAFVMTIGGVSRLYTIDHKWFNYKGRIFPPNEINIVISAIGKQVTVKLANGIDTLTTFTLLLPNNLIQNDAKITAVGITDNFVAPSRNNDSYILLNGTASTVIVDPPTN